MATPHRLRVISALALAALVFTTMLPGQIGRAQEGVGEGAPHDRGPHARVAGSLPEGVKLLPQGEAAQPAQLLVELWDEPAAVVYGRRARANGGENVAAQGAQAQLAVIESAQESVAGALAGLGATELFRVQRVYNGLAVSLPASQLGAVQALPGVKAVHVLRPHVLANRGSVPLIGAPALWQGLAATGGITITGRGVKLGIIDTGIDYTHANFEGSGSPSAYTLNNRRVITDSPAEFPGPRVVGGVDLVGDGYLGLAGQVGVPDPDPLDCHGHGSHVAGTAGGSGVLNTEAANLGNYDPPPAPGEFHIGPGVAPEADLYAIKIFGCSGSTYYTLAGVEWAVDPNGDGDYADRLDVINLSLGSLYGQMGVDEAATAAQNATETGLVVVAAAGNEGDAYYVSSSPAIAPAAISVAASVDAFDTMDAFSVTHSTLTGFYPAVRAQAFNWAGLPAPTSGRLVYPATQRSGCQAFASANAAAIAGNIVLLDWSHTAGGQNECDSATRAGHAAAAGATGYVLAYNLPAIDISIVGVASIPGVLTDQATGNLLKTVADDSPAGNPTVALWGGWAGRSSSASPGLVDTLSPFSSRGPAAGNHLKPDLAAPGQSIWSTSLGSGWRGTNLSGTSMAAPHVAGAMALLRQLHPAWTVEALKALAMNTALSNLRFSPTITSSVPVSGAAIYSPSRVGAGRLDLANAAQSQVVAYNFWDHGEVSISGGDQSVIMGQASAFTDTVEVRNFGPAPAQFNVEYVPVVDQPGVTVSPRVSILSVPAGQVRQFQVASTVVANLLADVPDPTVPPLLTVPRHALIEESGFVLLAAQDATFTAGLTGADAVPPVTTDLEGSATLIYNSATNQLSVTLQVTAGTPTTLTGASIYAGLPGQTGPAIVPIVSSDTPVSGTSTFTAGASLSPAQELALLGGDFYVSAATTSFPAGAIRGQVTPQGLVALKVPYFVAPRRASAMRAAHSQLVAAAPMVETTLPLAGEDITLGQAPAGTLSTVTALELAEVDGSEGRGSYADLMYLGVASNYTAFPAQEALAQAEVFFGIATQAEWPAPAAPGVVEFDIYLDTNQDGSADYILYNYNFGQAVGQEDPTDEFYTVLYRLSPLGWILQDYVNYYPANQLDTNVYNTNVLVLPVFLQDLGERQGASLAFDWWVRSYDRLGEADVSAVHTYDPGRPGIESSGGPAQVPIWPDCSGCAVPVRFNAANFDRNGSQGILLLHHHNTPGSRAEVIEVVRTYTHDQLLHLPIIRR